MISPLSFISVLLLWTGFGFSLFFHGTDTPLYALTLIPFHALCALALLPGLRAGWPVPRTAVFTLVGLFWVYLLISLFWSTSQFTSTQFFMIFSLLPGLFMAFVCAPDRRQLIPVIGYAMLAALAVLATWAVLQYFFLYNPEKPRVHHPLLDPNNLGGLMVMGLLPSVALFATAQGRMRFLVILPLMFYCGLLATQSRAGLLTAGLGFLVLLPFLVHYFRRTKTNFMILTVAAVAIPFLMNLIRASTAGEGLSSVADTLAVANSMDDRILLWKTALAMALDHLWTGTGLATFAYYYTGYRLPQDGSDGYFAHNDPLQLWAETGVAAPVIFYATLISILVRTIRAVKAARGNRALMLRVISPFSAMLAIAAHSHITFHLYLPAILIPLSCLLSFWYLAAAEALGEKEIYIFSSVRRRRTAGVVAAVLIVLSAGWIIRASVSINYISEAARDIAAGDPDGARLAVGKASFWAVPSDYNVPRYQARWRNAVLSARGGRQSADQNRVLVDEGLAAIERAIPMNRAVPHLKADRAKLYYFAYEYGLMPDGLDKAMRDLEQVIKADPLFIEGRLGLASAYSGRGELRKALAILEEGLPWPRPRGQADVNYLVTTARMKKQLGDEAGFQALINEAGARAIAYGLTSSRTEKGQ